MGRGHAQLAYAKSGGLSIGYSVLGTGDRDLVLAPGFVSHQEIRWEEPSLAYFLGGWRRSGG